MWQGVATQVRTHRTHGTQEMRRLRQDATPTDQTQGPFLLMLAAQHITFAREEKPKMKPFSSIFQIFPGKKWCFWSGLRSLL